MEVWYLVPYGIMAFGGSVIFFGVASGNNYPMTLRGMWLRLKNLFGYWEEFPGPDVFPTPLIYHMAYGGMIICSPLWAVIILFSTLSVIYVAPFAGLAALVGYLAKKLFGKKEKTNG